MIENTPVEPSAVTLEPIDPETAQELSLDHEPSEEADKTTQSHRNRTNQFVRWCNRDEIENRDTLSGRDLYGDELWRRGR